MESTMTVPDLVLSVFNVESNFDWILMKNAWITICSCLLLKGWLVNKSFHYETFFTFPWYLVTLAPMIIYFLPFVFLCYFPIALVMKLTGIRFTL
jgi:hypothetical protein